MNLIVALLLARLIIMLLRLILRDFDDGVDEELAWARHPTGADDLETFGAVAHVAGPVDARLGRRGLVRAVRAIPVLLDFEDGNLPRLPVGGGADTRPRAARGARRGVPGARGAGGGHGTVLLSLGWRSATFLWSHELDMRVACEAPLAMTSDVWKGASVNLAVSVGK